MKGLHQPDWNPASEENLRDQVAAYDTMRGRCPVAYSDMLGWSLFQHEDVMEVLKNPVVFSNAVSTHLSVPNGMDPPEHTEYRRIVERYFSPEHIGAFEPACRMIVTGLVETCLSRGEVEFMSDFALVHAIRVQCAFLGWPAKLHHPLSQWIMNNRAATLAQDRTAMSEIAREFDTIVNELLEHCLESGIRAEDDVTAALMREQVWDRPLTNGEIVSILRNWTVGEVGTISAAIGILAHFLAEHAGVQRQLRAEPALIPVAVDEILRIHGPLVANRRITTCPVEIGGRKIGMGERISINWVAANRDGAVFEEPETFRTDRDPAQNLLYGAGIHACPGEPLASMELRVFMEELLGRTAAIEAAPGKSPVSAKYPASGFLSLPLLIR